MKNRAHTTSGFTLIELAIVLGITAIIVGAVFAAWVGASGSQKVKQASEQITIMVGQVRNLYSGQSRINDPAANEVAFTTSLTAAGVMSGSVTPGATVSAGTGNLIRNPWGSFFTIGITGITVGRDAFFVRAWNIPNRTECVSLATKMFNGSRTEGLGRMDALMITPATHVANLADNVCLPVTPDAGVRTLTLFYTLIPRVF